MLVALDLEVIWKKSEDASGEASKTLELKQIFLDVKKSTKEKYIGCLA